MITKGIPALYRPASSTIWSAELNSSRFAHPKMTVLQKGTKSGDGQVRNDGVAKRMTKRMGRECRLGSSNPVAQNKKVAKHDYVIEESG